MRKSVALSVLVAFVLVIAFGTVALAAKPPKPGPGPGPIGGCPKDIQCLDVWIPVICADGITYSNQCYADRACAPGPCVPGEGGPVEL